MRAILDAKEDAGLELGVLVAVEVDEHLAKALDAAALAAVVDHGDFLTTTAGDLDGAFERIIMNPHPIASMVDHARLVAPAASAQW